MALEDLDDATLEDVAHLLGVPRFDASSMDPQLIRSVGNHENGLQAIAERMRSYLHHLIENPVSRMPDRRPTWEAMLEHCETLSPLQAYVMRNLLGTASNAGYEPMPQEVHLQFPRDHQVMMQAQVGWHFIVGSLWDADGGEYGIEIMFFGNAMYPPAQAEAFGLSSLENLAIEMQFAISERGATHHQAEPLVAAGTSGLIRTGTNPFGFAVGSNAMTSAHTHDFFPLRVVASGVDRGEDPEVEISMDLTLSSAKGILAQGDGGAMPSIGGIGTFYYSIPNIQIDPAVSTIHIGDREIDIERGQLWFDHQWGSLDGLSRSEVLRASNSISAPEPIGWDWFMTHLTDDRQVTMFAPHSNEYRQFYGCTGDDPPPTMTRRVSGTYMDADAGTRVVWGTMDVDDWVRVDRSPRPDRYPPTNTWYPNHYRFKFDDLPADIASFTMEPIVEGGQSAFFANGAQICEGAVVLRNPDGEDIGRGFAEAVSYADTARNQLRLAGLPDTEEMLALVRPQTPDPRLAADNMAFVAEHTAEMVDVLKRAKGLQFLTEDVDGALAAAAAAGGGAGAAGASAVS